MAINYLKGMLRKVNRDFDSNEEKSFPYHKFVNISKYMRLLLYFSSSNSKKGELMKLETECVNLLMSNKTEVDRLAHVIGLEFMRDLIGDENFSRRTLVNLDMANKADRLEAIRKAQPRMKKTLPENDYLEWCEVNELDPSNDDGYLLDFSGSKIKNWIKDQHRDESVYPMEQAIEIAIDEFIIDGDESSIRNLKTQISLSGASKGGKRGEWDFRRVKPEYQHQES